MLWFLCHCRQRNIKTSFFHSGDVLEETRHSNCEQPQVAATSLVLASGGYSGELYEQTWHSNCVQPQAAACERRRLRATMNKLNSILGIGCSVTLQKERAHPNGCALALYIFDYLLRFASRVASSSRSSFGIVSPIFA